VAFAGLAAVKWCSVYFSSQAMSNKGNMPDPTEDIDDHYEVTSDILGQYGFILTLWLAEA